MLVKTGETWYNRLDKLLEVIHVSDKMNVRRIAGLAKLTLTAEEETRMSADMAEILAFARQLQSIDLDGVPPAQHVLEQRNVLREDEVRPSMPCETVLSAAPAREEDYIAVPRAVE